MARTLADLYADRCSTSADGSLVPHFWQPQPATFKPHCLFSDERQLIPEEQLELVTTSMKRLIALGLDLEIDVGKFVNEQARGDLPDAPYVKQLLKSAVADEARHELGFKYAAQVYGTAGEVESASLRDRWVALANKYQPLAIAGVLEQEVFLVTLGVMRLVGGPTLSDLAMQIAKDESRHVATNRAITRWLGVEFGNDVTQLVDETLHFAISGMSVPLTAGRKLDYDFAIAACRDLRETGTARQLDRLTRVAAHKMPFEVGNRSLYTSRSTEDGTTVY